MPGGDIEKTINPPEVPIWHCSWWGLPCKTCYQAPGGLLPHPFTLTYDQAQAVCFLLRYPSGCPARALPGTISLWSPDFPRPRRAAIIQFSAQKCSRREKRQGQLQSAFKAASSAKSKRLKGPLRWGAKCCRSDDKICSTPRPGSYP